MSNRLSRVLFVAIDVIVQPQLAAALRRQGLQVDSVPDLEVAIDELHRAPPDVVVVDLAKLGDPREALAVLRRADERVAVIALLEAGVPALREGADRFIAKPVDAVALGVVVHALVETTRSRRRSLALNVAQERKSLDPFVGDSAVIQAFSRQAHRILDGHAPVLIMGETGTGKGVLANWLHHHGPRAQEAFVDINCAGLSREFVESELFGHERGAFTGAAAAKLGLLEVAHRGTAFLDEIGEIDLQLQPRLLKVLEDKRFRRLGDVRDHVVDVRLIAATNRDLGKRSREGTFRADLYYRINTITLTVPSLRNRREDIPTLARRIANSLDHDMELSSDAMRAMMAYDWPGNIRELRNVIERAIMISNRAPKITRDDLRFDSESGDAGKVEEEPLGTLVEAERRHIERVMRHEKGSVERAAVRLGVSRSTLYQKLRRFQIATRREELA